MPITPTEAAKLTLVEVSQLLELTRTIDERIRKIYTGEPSKIYTVDLDSKPSARLQVCIKQIYQKKGWIVSSLSLSNAFTLQTSEEIQLYIPETGKIKEENKYSGLTFEEIRLDSIDMGDDNESIKSQDTREQRISNKEDSPGER